jgi:predicted RNA-binding protein
MDEVLEKQQEVFVEIVVDKFAEFVVLGGDVFDNQRVITGVEVMRVDIDFDFSLFLAESHKHDDQCEN